MIPGVSGFCDEIGKNLAASISSSFANSYNQGKLLAIINKLAGKVYKNKLDEARLLLPSDRDKLKWMLLFLKEVRATVKSRKYPFSGFGAFIGVGFIRQTREEYIELLRRSEKVIEDELERQT